MNAKNNTRKWRRRLFSVLCAVALILCYFVGIRYIILNIGADETDSSDNGKHYVALVTKSTTSAFWKSVYAGANAAGTEYNLDFTMAGPDNEEDYVTQNELIAEAVNNGAEALVFSSVDYEGNASAIDEAAALGVKIVVIDSDVDSDAVSCRIGTDNYEAGQMAARAILENGPEEMKVGIVNFDKNSANGQQREKGFRDALSDNSDVEIVSAINVISTTEDAMDGTKQMLAEHPEINVIATFNEWTSLGVGYAIEELGLGDETYVVAFDSNVVCVGMLENGDLDALIVQNPFAMGYLGVECAYNLINGIDIGETVVDTATTMITRENMFEDESQKVLFSFD